MCKLIVHLPLYFINNNWMGCTLSEQNNTGNALGHIKRDQIIHVATLNYCGILKNPFQFYSGHFLSELSILSSLFNQLRDKYIPCSANETFSWKFGKLDKRIKQKRFSPLYNPTTGIVDNKFIGRVRFTSLWNSNFDIALKEENVQFSAQEREEALNFDLLAFHTFLNYVYGVDSVDQMEGKTAQQYIKKIGPFFQQAFLSEQKKIQKFINGLQNTFSDIIFLQEPSQALIEVLLQKKDYCIQLSPDKDTLVCALRQKFKQFLPRQQLFSSLSKDELALLDWNGHSAMMAADKYILISGHLSSKDNVNSENVRDLKAGIQLLKTKMPGYEVIIGADINSFLGNFNKDVKVYPSNSQKYTSLKMRTSMQTQTKKAQKMIKESKDSIVTTLDLIDGQVSTIGLNQPNDNYFLPQNDHPFDHFLVFAKLNMKKTSEENKL